MAAYRKIACFWAVLFISATLSLLARQILAAQEDEEMAILRMFYTDKELVISPTRHKKPVSRVAENITVITAKDIERMNAHTVADILDRVPGVFVNFNHDFGATSLIYIQGSDERHVLVLMDDIPWNFMAGGNAETNGIPVGIIERIEIIKGPASSAWGSSLGGVINIITKSPGTGRRPKGMISASVGERSTHDYRAQVSGTAGRMGYYLFFGKQDSDGLRGSRDHEMGSLYGKLRIPLTKDVDLGLSIGYSDPDTDFGAFRSIDIRSQGKGRTSFVTATLDAALPRGLNLATSFHYFSNRFVQKSDTLGLGFMGPRGTPFLDAIYDEETFGGSVKLTLEHGMHCVLLGMDMDRGELEQEIDAGPFLRSMGAPATSFTDPDRERWALYANDTITFGRWSIMPGIRYDHDSITGSFVSPSLGVTYRIRHDSIIRGSVARGFTLPPLSWSSGGGLFLDPNRSLDSEKIVSYQAGFETAFLRYIWLKGTLFRHETDDTMTVILYGGGPPSYNDMYRNNGDMTRHGIEMEAETVPFHNILLKAGFSLVHLSPSNEGGSSDMREYTMGIVYDDHRSFMAELFGHYMWWDYDPRYGASYDDIIWDLNVSKKIWSKGWSSGDIFLTGHNIFSGSQYTLGDSKNPRRWIEAGMRIRF
jgi:vitamin B12 transporter